ncbi:MAG: DUF554 domain-containing protein [Clostridia bacterium]|nr:DUF554 domain-containing protein [Clostridia bacterium]
MLGVWANAVAIIAGGLLGCLLRGGIKEKLRDTINYGLALCVMIIGVSGALKTDDTLVMIVSVIVGSVIGEWLRIEDGITRLGDWAQSKLAKGDTGFSAGFVSASLLFCVGAMAVVGALEAGLQNKPDTLLAKSALDGVFSIILASTYGPGVIFSAVPVLIYQGAIALLAGVLSPLLTDALITEMSAVGSLLIVAIGINSMECLKSRIRVGNMLPAILIPCVYLPVAELLKGLF